MIYYQDSTCCSSIERGCQIKSGSAQPNRQKVASLTWDQVKVIAEDKMKDLNCFTVESAMKLIAGTARSMGITVKGTSLVNNLKLQLENE